MKKRICLTLIGEASFRHCYSLKTIYFRGSEADGKGMEIDHNALIDSDCNVVTGYTGDRSGQPRGRHFGGRYQSMRSPRGPHSFFSRA